MTLNPLDIRRQQFARKTFGGYDTDEVDGFVKQLADQWERVLDEARVAGERAAEVENKLRHYERVEMALQEALETARESGRRSEAMAEQKAKLVVEEAELRARQIVQDAERDRHGMRQDVVKLSSRQAEIGARLRGFLLSELEILAQFQGDDPVGFIKLQAAHPPGSGPYGDRAVGADAHRLAPHEAHGDTAERTAPSRPEVFSEISPAPVSEPPATEVPAADVPVTEMPLVEAPVAEARPAEPALTSPEAPIEVQTAPPAESFVSPPAPPAPADEPAAPTWAADPPAPSWDLRSLVTGEGDNVAGSEAERDRIRRILDDLD